jgi:uncharacterized YccA/Bax inhibitor family protein
MRIRGENPVFKRMDYSTDWTDAATYKGVASKTMLLLFITAISAYSIAINIGTSWSFGTMIGALILAPLGAFIFVILAHRNEQLAFIYSILYAIFEGAFLGVISLIVVYQVGTDAVLYAMGGTFGSLFVMLILYSTRIIKVGQGFRNFMLTALAAVFFFIIVGLVMWLATGTAYFYSNFYLAVVLFSLIISVLFLLYDFDRIESYVSGNAGKEHEWSLSLGLITTIVWIYIEILRLILILSRRSK